MPSRKKALPRGEFRVLHWNDKAKKLDSVPLKRVSDKEREDLIDLQRSTIARHTSPEPYGGRNSGR